MDIIGRPPSKLIEGDTLIPFGKANEISGITGTVTLVGSKPFVTWSDRTEPEALRGGITKSLRRAGEVLDWEKN